MEFAAEVLAVIVGLVALVNRFVAGFITPLFEKYELDRFWLMYIAWVFAGVVVWLTGLNLFSEIIPDPLIGQIITAVIGGGGANILHDAINK